MHRWTKHRVYDANGKDARGVVPVSLIAVARAAAEETLQGSPLAAGWLKLFHSQLSQTDSYWLRWRGDMAESAELRRAYSGLYGRFFARALLATHLRLSNFLSLKRNGLDVPNSISVRRQLPGDIPDWVAWDDRNGRFVLCEAKGSLCAKDFLSNGTPGCVASGKGQFKRVAAFDQSGPIAPAEWVAASRWATDHRRGEPVTLLWDPPSAWRPYSADERKKHRAAMGEAWLQSIAPGLGWSSAKELRSPDRRREAVVVRAKSGPIPPEMQWKSQEDLVEEIDVQYSDQAKFGRRTGAIRKRITEVDNLRDSAVYATSGQPAIRGHEISDHEHEYTIALVSDFGIRPIRSQSDLDYLHRAQQMALQLKRPALIVGVPVEVDPTTADETVWQDEAGIASTSGLAVFDLRLVGWDRADN